MKGIKLRLSILAITTILIIAFVPPKKGEELTINHYYGVIAITTSVTTTQLESDGSGFIPINKNCLQIIKCK